MKLFSRKALVAGATAVAVSFAGVNVASAEPTESINGLSSSSDIFNASSKLTSENESSETDTPTSESETPTSEENNGEEDGGSSADPEDIKGWISVISAVVGALSTIYGFLNRINN